MIASIQADKHSFFSVSCTLFSYRRYLQSEELVSDRNE